MTSTYLTADEVAKLTRLQKTTVYKLAARGEIPVYRVRRRLLFPAAQVHEWIRRGGAMPTHPAAG